MGRINLRNITVVFKGDGHEWGSQSCVQLPEMIWSFLGEITGDSIVTWKVLTASTRGGRGIYDL